MFDGENISFDACLVLYIYIYIYIYIPLYICVYIYINSTNIPPIMIILVNGIYETQSSVAVACFLPGRAKDLSASLYRYAVVCFTCIGISSIVLTTLFIDIQKNKN